VLDVVGLGFGIATPSAAHKTALEEHDGADPRTVVNRKALDIENSALGVVNAHNTCELRLTARELKIYFRELTASLS